MKHVCIKKTFIQTYRNQQSFWLAVQCICNIESVTYGQILPCHKINERIDKFISRTIGKLAIALILYTVAQWFFSYYYCLVINRVTKTILTLIRRITITVLRCAACLPKSTFFRIYLSLWLRRLLQKNSSVYITPADVLELKMSLHQGSLQIYLWPLPIFVLFWSFLKKNLFVQKLINFNTTDSTVVFVFHHKPLAVHIVNLFFKISECV